MKVKKYIYSDFAPCQRCLGIVAETDAKLINKLKRNEQLNKANRARSLEMTDLGKSSALQSISLPPFP